VSIEGFKVDVWCVIKNDMLKKVELMFIKVGVIVDVIELSCWCWCYVYKNLCMQCWSYVIKMDRIQKFIDW
jgi:hypothetical protein